MTPEKLNTLQISAAGDPGSNGTQSWDSSSSREAPLATPGRAGRAARAPTQGSLGRDVSVKVRCSPDGSVLIEPVDSASGPGHFRTVSPAHDFFINCRGGNGGRGGVGENGQRGGKGWTSRVSRRRVNSPNPLHSDGTPAVGGAEKVASTEKPGAGGRGGRGGEGCSWTETCITSWTDSEGNPQTGTHTTHHSRPSGSSGAQGPPSRTCTLPLRAGRPGLDGSSRITVLRKCGAGEVYSDRYQLVVESFDVADENEDGINGPGEYLMVKNIWVQNIGAMPSPRHNPLHVHIRATPWLEPDTTQLLEFPNGIPTGATMQVPGVFRALIKNEQHQRASGEPFRRLKRCVPEFGGGESVVYEYPVAMSQLKSLDAVAIGDRVKFSNISAKPYGDAATPRRRVWSRIADADGTFDLVSVSDEEESTSQSVTQMVDIVEPVAQPERNPHRESQEKIRSMLQREIEQLLQTLYGPGQGKAAANKTRELSSEVKQNFAKMKKENPGFDVADRAHELCTRRLAEITKVPRGSGFVNLGDLDGVGGSVSMSAEELAEKRRVHERHLAQMKKDRAWSEKMLADMVSQR
ncbi:hypothetical protein B0T16DRAFT_391142 [Cercophora newfieldiana]|uniref:DUF7932 domain-containing protein n=1 Tax=Cercophora newfieldiana TaxID=92897 RepID=A0AA39Y7E6_9PEZI|nr:hypothetical protein B0T16DRAFT_391142 [Cercophora newfieldiana]